MTNTQEQEKKFRLFFSILIRLTMIVLFVIAAWNLISFFISATTRLHYPFSLYWYEDDGVYQVLRILKGQKLYVKPSIDYIPFIYAPFYYYVSAAATYLAGNGFFALRLVSLIATIGTLCIIALFVWRETTSRLHAFLAAGYYAGFYFIVKMWFDIGRIDNLNIYFIMLAMYCIRFYRTKVGYIAAAVTIALACFTKQTSVVIFAAFAVYTILYCRKLSVYFILSFLICFVGCTLALQYYFEGWYLYYVFQLPSSHAFAPLGVAVFIFYDVLVCIPFGIGVVGNYLMSSKSVYYKMMFAVGIGYSLLSRANFGSDSNNILLLFSTQSVLVGLALYKAWSTSRQYTSVIEVYKQFLVIFIVLGQFVLLHWNPFLVKNKSHTDYYATSDDRKLIRYLQNIEGDVYMTNHRNLLRDANKRTFLHIDSLNELVGSYGSNTSTKEGRAIYKEFAKKVRRKEFWAIILDPARELNPRINPFLDDIKKNYVKSQITFELISELYVLYVPRSTPQL